MKAIETAIPLKDFARVVSVVSAFASDRDVVPALQYIYFKKGTVSAFNGVVGAVWDAPWPLDAVVSAKLGPSVASLVERGHDTIDVSVLDHFHVRAGKTSRSKFPILGEADAMPEELSRRVAAKRAAPLTPEFWADVAIVERTMGKNEATPIFCGVYWAEDGALMSTDNQRLTACFPKVRVKPPRGAVLVPAHLLRMLDDARAAYVGVAVDDSAIWFTTAGGAVFGLMLSGAFPAASVLDIIKGVRTAASAKNGEGAWVELPSVVDVDGLLAYLLSFAEPPTNRMRVDVGADSVRVAVEERDGRALSGEETIPAKVSGSPTAFHVNGQHLRDALKVSLKFWCAVGKPLYFVDGERRVEHLVSVLAG